jgi:hypothetical protein
MGDRETQVREGPGCLAAPTALRFAKIGANHQFHSPDNVICRGNQG